TPEGFAAAATSLLGLPEADDTSSVRLLRRLPLKEQESLTVGITREALGSSGTRATPATHVLFEGRAIPISTNALVVGRSPLAAAPADPQAATLAPTAAVLTLPDGLAGVSRRHCTFVRNADELVLIDHSNYGTVVNGERVSERVRLHAGDKVRL